MKYTKPKIYTILEETKNVNVINFQSNFTLMIVPMISPIIIAQIAVAPLYGKEVNKC